MKKILAAAALVGMLASCTTTEKGTAIGAASALLSAAQFPTAGVARPLAPLPVASWAQQSANRRSTRAIASIATVMAAPTKHAASAVTNSVRISTCMERLASRSLFYG